MERKKFESFFISFVSFPATMSSQDPTSQSPERRQRGRKRERERE
jgi:hypothetical protein